MIRNKVGQYFKGIDVGIMEVHKETGIARTTVTRLFYDEVVNINMDTMDTLCRTYNCKLDDLFEYVPDDAMTKKDKIDVAKRRESVSHYSELRRRSSAKKEEAAGDTVTQ